MKSSDVVTPVVRPSVGVVIPTKGRLRELLTTLSSVLRQDLPPSEIIVVDQSESSAADKAIAESVAEFGAGEGGPQLVYRWEPRLWGPAAARNYGARLARSDVVVIMDDDITLEPQCLRILVDTLVTAPNAGGIGGVETQLEDSPLVNLLYRSVFFLGPFADSKYWISRYSQRMRPGAYKVGTLKTCLAAYWRHVLLKYPFNEAWKAPLLEDKEHGLRSAKEFSYYVNPAARGLHRVSRLNRLQGRRAYEAAAIAWAYYYKTCLSKSAGQMVLYGWLNFGLLAGALANSLRQRSPEPLKGLFSGWWKSLRGFKDQDYVVES